MDYAAAVWQDTYVMPDLRFLIDFHWAISCLDGGSPSSYRCCSDDRSASANLGRGDGAAIGSNCMQKLSSASSESPAAVDDGSSSTSASSTSSPAAATDAAAAATPLPNVRSSDKTNRLEFLRCWSIVRPMSPAVSGRFVRARHAFAATRVSHRGFQMRGRRRGRRSSSLADGNIVTAVPTIAVEGRGPDAKQPSAGVVWWWWMVGDSSGRVGSRTRQRTVV